MFSTLVGETGLPGIEDSCLGIAGMLTVDEDAERSPFCVGDVVFAMEPLFKNDPGRSPNLGNANEKSPPLLLPLYRPRG